MHCFEMGIDQVRRNFITSNDGNYKHGCSSLGLYYWVLVVQVWHSHVYSVVTCNAMSAHPLGELTFTYALIGFFKFCNVNTFTAWNLLSVDSLRKSKLIWISEMHIYSQWYELVGVDPGMDIR